MTRGFARVNLGMNELTRLVQSLVGDRPILQVAKAWDLPPQRLYDLFRFGSTSDDTLRAISKATGCPYQTLLLAAHPEDLGTSPAVSPTGEKVVSR